MPLAAGYLSWGGAAVKGMQFPLSGIAKVTLTNPIAVSTNSLKTAVAGPNTATNVYGRTSALGTIFDGAGASGIFDFAKNVVITVTHGAAVVALSGIITGIDIFGDVLTEAWSVTAGTVSKTFTGAKAFARVDSVTVVAVADASTDTVVIGHGQVFGLPVKCSVASGLKEVAVGAVVTTGTVVATSSSAAADSRGTYSPATAPDGTKTYVLWFITDDPSNS